jgi:hypothetical protein
MIIGNGDLACTLRRVDKENRLFFASGVSNSKETRPSEYEREEKLLFSQDKNKHIVYFSSLCVYYSDTMYAKHKIRMENLVRENFQHYTIIRIGNITWGINPNTLINFLKNKIKNNESFEVREVYRYILDKDEFLHWIEMIPNWNSEINIPGKRMLVRDVIKEYVI